MIIVVLFFLQGIGASIGGYAGDGIPVAKAIASVVDTLITHPNVMNGAQMYWPQVPSIIAPVAQSYFNFVA